MDIKKTGIRTLLFAVLLAGMVQVPTASAETETNYSVTVKEAFELANAHTASFIESDFPKFNEWKGASIDPEPLELYDPNGQKLYYQFSVYKDNKLIGIIDIGADKRLGQAVQLVEFDPYPFSATKTMEKSIDVAKKEYPEGEIQSTRMVVYSYPQIGAITVVKDNTTGDKHRIIVDVYTLDVVEDKPATETQPGVWSIYERRLKNGIDENLKNWHESEQLVKSMKQEAARNGNNVSVPVIEENTEEMSNDSTTTSTTAEASNAPSRGQENNSLYGAAGAQMIALAKYCIANPNIHL
ncbi:C39 family peptidase [Methanosarcina sp. T3]|uniref:C39 family peptidase n=1 Tax=Methanosarcina sp. T3 TaxID=3439062 RepID=UPI003F82E213